MRNRIAVSCARRTYKTRADLLTWATRFANSPATSDRDRRDRQIVAELLAAVSA